ncbi:MAG: hypothetical protein AAFW83_01160 [Pseudomonadota bacterium]
MKIELKKIPDYIIYLAAALLLINELTQSVFGFRIVNSQSVIFSVFSFALVAFVVSIGGKLERVIQKIDEINDLSDETGENHISPKEFAERIRNQSKIDILTLSGTKSVALGDERVIEALKDPSSKATIRILLANPYSEAITNRYKYDESDSYESGLSGIERKLRQLHSILMENPGVREKVEIRVFGNYPTVSIARFDDDFYSSVYGYKLRGSDCPKIHAKHGTPYADFLCKHFERVYEASVSLNDWVNAGDEQGSHNV